MILEKSKDSAPRTHSNLRAIFPPLFSGHGEFQGGGVEELDALGDLGHGFEPVVRILDADHRRLDAETVEFL